ncbi:MAG: hypothetical protein MJ175_10550, partial [Clostridia bacterium]|nr:hypothetical protein [Clostridia bacterium]
MNREPDRNRQDFSDRFDPSQYDMYAAFRTRERAEKRALKRRDGRSIYDVPRETRRSDAPGGIYRQGTRGASSAGNRTKTQPPRPTGGAGGYHIARNKPAANHTPA